MPTYNYECLDCLAVVEEKYKDKILENGGNLELAIFEQEVMFETIHSMNPSETELYAACECPRCGSRNCKKVFHGMNVTSYTRGYGFLDRAGCHRDMNRYKLTQGDPYAQYRQDGEVDHIKHQLDKGGKYNPNTKYFRTASSDSDSSSVENAVKEVVSKSDK